MDEKKRGRFFDPYHQQRSQAGDKPFWFRAALSLTGIFGFSLCMTCLYLAMRGIMRLGGFVASGGPYEIAHPAPRYVWIFPVSIMVGLMCLFLHGFQARKLGGLNLLPLAWPALFISLGWNFLEFGFRPPGGAGFAWGWLICGVVFWLMGFIPLLIFISYFRKGFRERRSKAEADGAPSGDPGGGSKGRRRVLVFLQVAALFLGIYCGVLFLNSQTEAKEIPSPATPVNESAVATGTGRQPQVSTGSQPAGEVQAPSAALHVSIAIGGKQLEIEERPAGTYQLFYDGNTFYRLNDLPAEARRIFQDALKMLQALVIVE